jgi:hypothetical protein
MNLPLPSCECLSVSWRVHSLPVPVCWQLRQKVDSLHHFCGPLQDVLGKHGVQYPASDMPQEHGRKDDDQEQRGPSNYEEW